MCVSTFNQYQLCYFDLDIGGVKLASACVKVIVLRSEEGFCCQTVVSRPRLSPERRVWSISIRLYSVTPQDFLAVVFVICNTSLVPRPPFFCSSVCVHYNTWKWKSDEKGVRTPITWNTSGGHEVDMGGGGCPSTNLCAVNHRTSFLWVKYCQSHERLGSWLSLKLSMMKSSTRSSDFCSSVCIQYNTQKRKSGEK